MNRTEHRFVLDIHKTVSPVSLYMKKNDTGRKLLIHLTQNGYPYHIADGCTAKLSVERSDGKQLRCKCKIENCVIIHEVTTDLTSVVGVHTCEIVLLGADDSQITSASFSIVIETPACDGDPGSDELQEVESISLDGANVSESFYYFSGTGESGRKINMKSAVGDDVGSVIVGPDTVLTLKAKAEVFGDAEAADVLEGKTFTSSAGLKKTGTHKCTGGASISATDDGEGNVVISLTGLSATADDDGNIVIA